MKKNTILFTKDGRHIGNAIVSGHQDDLVIITTDYGSVLTFSVESIKELFYIDEEPIDRPSHKNAHD